MPQIHGNGGYNGVKEPSLSGITKIGKYRLLKLNEEIYEVNMGRFQIGGKYCDSFTVVDCPFYPSKIIGVFTLFTIMPPHNGKDVNGVAILMQDDTIMVFNGKEYLPAGSPCAGIFCAGKYYFAEHFDNRFDYNSNISFFVDGLYIYKRITQKDTHGYEINIISDIYGRKPTQFKKIERQGNGCVVHSEWHYSTSNGQTAGWHFDTLPLIQPSRLLANLPEANEKIIELPVDETEIKLKSEANKIRAEYHDVIASMCAEAVVSSAEKLRQRIVVDRAVEIELNQTKKDLEFAKEKLEEYARYLECVICFKESKKRMAYSCGHTAVCEDCETADIKNCPICQTPIMFRMKVIVAQ